MIGEGLRRAAVIDRGLLELLGGLQVMQSTTCGTITVRIIKGDRALIWSTRRSMEPALEHGRSGGEGKSV